jgi:hypothetical protein
MSWAEAAASVAKFPGPALLAAGGFSKTITSHLPPEEAKVYGDFHEAMANWFEKKDGAEFAALHSTWWPRLVAASEAKPQYSKPTSPAAVALSTAYLQLHAIKSLVPTSALPADALRDMSPEDYAELGKRCARKTSTKIFQRRVEALIDNKKKPWREQHDHAGRMGWQHPVKEREFEKPQRNAVVALACGSEAKWLKMGGDELLRVEDGESASVIRLSDEDRERLKPWLPAA